MDKTILSFDDSAWEIFDPEYAEGLKNLYPDVWAMSSGYASDYYNSVLTEIAKKGGVAETPEEVEVLEIRESWANRNSKYGSKSISNYIQCAKFMVVSPDGEPTMKHFINSEIAKANERDGWREKSAKPRIRDPKGGLTAAGRKYFKRTEGANLKPGVRGAADTPEKLRRKGSFLTRFFTNPSGPMKDEKGRPTRLALSAAAWGEPVPQDASDAARLAAKGRRMLERYENSKKKAKK